MKNANQLAELALSSDYDALEDATSKDLVLALGVVAEEQSPDEEPEILWAMDAILCELERRTDVDLKTRRWCARIHQGVLAQL